jgi:hypothetical protein
VYNLCSGSHVPPCSCCRTTSYRGRSVGLEKTRHGREGSDGPRVLDRKQDPDDLAAEKLTNST